MQLNGEAIILFRKHGDTKQQLPACDLTPRWAAFNDGNIHRSNIPAQTITLGFASSSCSALAHFCSMNVSFCGSQDTKSNRFHMPSTAWAQNRIRKWNLSGHKAISLKWRRICGEGPQACAKIEDTYTLCLLRKSERKQSSEAEQQSKNDLTRWSDIGRNKVCFFRRKRTSSS